MGKENKRHSSQQAHIGSSATKFLTQNRGPDAAQQPGALVHFPSGCVGCHSKGAPIIDPGSSKLLLGLCGPRAAFNTKKRSDSQPYDSEHTESPLRPGPRDSEVRKMEVAMCLDSLA